MENNSCPTTASSFFSMRQTTRRANPFNDLVKLEDKPILGDGPVGTGPSSKIMDHYSFLDLARIHLHGRTQSQNKWLHVLQPLVSTTLFCFNERT